MNIHTYHTTPYHINACHSWLGVARGSRITPAPYEKAQAYAAPTYNIIIY